MTIGRPPDYVLKFSPPPPPPRPPPLNIEIFDISPAFGRGGLVLEPDGLNLK